MIRLDIFRILVIVENTLIHRYGNIREPVIYVLADFTLYGGGYPPLSAKEKNLLFSH